MHLKVPHPIPYQGSKRWIADTICECIPAGTRWFFEPFAGSAAVTLAAAARGLAEQYFISDIHEPLMTLWQAIIDHPRELADNYERLWTEQIG